MKTQVRIKESTYQCCLVKGDVGYIDGYVRGGNNTPCAVVVSGNKIDLVSIWALNVITKKEEEL